MMNLVNVVLIAAISTAYCHARETAADANSEVLLPLIRKLEHDILTIKKQFREDMSKVKQQIQQLEGELNVKVLAINKLVAENKKQMGGVKRRVIDLEFLKGKLLADGPRKIVKTLLGTVCIGNIYRIAFQVKPTAWLSDGNWASIIDFRSDKIKRLPVIAFYKKKIMVSSRLVNQLHQFWSPSIQNLNEWITVEIKQDWKASSYIYTITINGKEEVSIINAQPKKICNVTAYLASPSWLAQPGYIRGLSLYSEDT